MATLTITLPGNTSICNGKQITFRAPCDCTGVTGIVLEGITYELVDTVGTCINSVGDLFIEGSMISVILDTENFKAYIQNAINYSAIPKVVFQEDEPANPVNGIIWLKPI